MEGGERYKKRGESNSRIAGEDKSLLIRVVGKESNPSTRRKRIWGKQIKGEKKRRKRENQTNEASKKKVTGKN